MFQISAYSQTKEKTSAEEYHNPGSTCLATTSIPELHKEDLIGLNENLSEFSDIHLNDLNTDLINECILLDLTNKYSKTTHDKVDTRIKACLLPKTGFKQTNYSDTTGTKENNFDYNIPLDLTTNNYLPPMTSTPKRDHECFNLQQSSILPDQ